MVLRLQRDSEVGVISGALEQEGFYGEEIQFMGFGYFDNGVQLVIEESEFNIAVKFYSMCMQRKIVSRIFFKAFRVYGNEKEIARQKLEMKNEFEVYLSGKVIEKMYAIPIEDEQYLAVEEINNCLSGFSYYADGKKMSMVNGYFPQTVAWWFEKKIKCNIVSNIVLKEKNKIERLSEQVQKFKLELVQ